MTAKMPLFGGKLSFIKLGGLPDCIFCLFLFLIILTSKSNIINHKAKLLVDRVEVGLMVDEVEDVVSR